MNNEPMPWRLQIAMAAMQSPHLEQLLNPLSTVENATQIYLLMADALLAEHKRTAPAQESREDKIRHVIDSLSSTPPNGFADACKKRTAIEKLTSMLNESKCGQHDAQTQPRDPDRAEENMAPGQR